jgi:hypothetical protein
MKLNIQRLKAVFNIQNPSDNKRCNEEAMRVITSLAPKGCTIVQNNGNLLIRKGKASGPHPFFISHMDQVHEYVPFMQLHIDDNILSAKDGNDMQCGVGGDDKCGIYLALEMLHRLNHCTAVFVKDEEIGCIGSGAVPLAWFDHASFILQADRNNRTFDIIRDTNGMSCASDEFMNAVLALPEAVRHSENTGSITDVGELASRGLCISMVNISSGYHNPHSHNEIVKLDELAIACDIALAMSHRLGNKRWDNIPKSQWSPPKQYAGTTKYTNWYTTKAPTTSFSKPDEYDSLPSNGYREKLISCLELAGYCRVFDKMDTWTTLDLEDEVSYIDSGVMRSYFDDEELKELVG